jgi:excisionase family DNA binding protein
MVVPDRQAHHVAGLVRLTGDGPMHAAPALPHGTPIARDRDSSVPPPLLSIEDVAHYLRVSPRWVYGQVRSGRLPAMLIARSWRLRQENVDGFVESFRNVMPDAPPY